MRKRLALLVGPLIVVAIILMARFDQDYGRPGHSYDVKCVKPNDPSSAATSLSCTINPIQNADQGKDKSEWWHKLIAWPEGITAWLLLVTLGGIFWQAQATADAANAAYGSVAFAKAQWNLMIEEKRARLDLSVDPTSLGVEVAGEDLVHLIATVSVRNIGASKAFIGRTSGTLITNLRNEPLGDTEYSPLDLPEKYIEPDKPLVPVKVYCFPTATTATFAECLEAGTFTLHFFGFIEYETLGFWWRKEFGYDWKVVGRALGAMLGLPDPYPNSPRPARDRITYGYWTANEAKDKAEYPISRETDKHPQNPN